jgi:GNAT superfamily N-acetyltransferase
LVSVRKIQLEDLDNVFKLTELFSTSFKIKRELFEVSFVNLINDSATHFILAEINNVIVGYCLCYNHYTLYANGKVAWVEEIFVLEEYRRKGIARRLMNEMEKWARSRDSKLIALATRRAREFYLSIGYEESAIFFRKLL